MFHVFQENQICLAPVIITYWLLSSSCLWGRSPSSWWWLELFCVHVAHPHSRKSKIRSILKIVLSPSQFLFSDCLMCPSGNVRPASLPMDPTNTRAIPKIWSHRTSGFTTSAWSSKLLINHPNPTPSWPTRQSPELLKTSPQWTPQWIPCSRDGTPTAVRAPRFEDPMKAHLWLCVMFVSVIYILVCFKQFYLWYIYYIKSY